MKTLSVQGCNSKRTTGNVNEKSVLSVMTTLTYILLGQRESYCGNAVGRFWLIRLTIATWTPRGPSPVYRVGRSFNGAGKRFENYEELLSLLKLSCERGRETSMVYQNSSHGARTRVQINGDYV